MHSTGNNPQPDYINPELVKLFDEAKKELSPALSSEEKQDRLCQLEKSIIAIFKEKSPDFTETYSFQNFTEKFTTSYPLIKPLFSDLLFHLKLYEDIIYYDLNTLNPDADLENVLMILCDKLPKNEKIGQLLIDKIETRFSGSEDKLKLAFRVFVTSFALNTLQKFESFNANYKQLFAIEVAKLEANQVLRSVSRNINFYGIKDESALIEIAKIALNKPLGVEVSLYIYNYGIKTESALIEIAEFALEKHKERVSQYIKFYGIKDEKVMIKIAKKAASYDGALISQYFKNYGITNKEALIEILKIAVNAPNGADISKYIQNYGITDETALIEIAKIAAAQDGGKISEWIGNYGITDKEALIEIAKIAAKAPNNEDVSKYIQNYGITDQNALIEIAKNSAGQDGAMVSAYIRSYNITDQLELIKIAKIAAAQDGEGTSAFIQFYGITNKEALIEIAKIAAFQNGEGTSEYINKYGIQDKKALYQIATIAATQNGEGTVTHIRSYGKEIQSTGTLLSILLTAMISSQGKALQHWKIVFPLNFQPHLMQSFDLLKNEIIDTEAVYDQLSTFCTDQKWDLSKQLIGKLQKKDKETQKSSLLYLACFLANSTLKKINTDQFKFLINTKLLESSFDYNDPTIRYRLINLMTTLAQNETEVNYVSPLLNKSPPHTRIPILFISLLHGKGLSKKICDEQIKLVSNTLFKAGKNLRVYINTLNTIVSDKKLSIADKEFLLSKIEITNALNTLTAIQSIKDMDKMSELKKVDLQDKPVSDILENSVQELIPIEISNFADKFTKCFANARVPNYILAYAAKLSSNKWALKSLSYFLKGILTDTYPKMRYEIDKSEHLQTVFANNLELLEKWKIGEKAFVGDFLQTTDASLKPIDFSILLKDCLIEHHHLQQEDLPILFDFLNNKTNEKQVNLDTNEAEETLLAIEENCIKLMNKELKFEDQKKLLKEIQNDLKVIMVEKPTFSQFGSDINSFFNGLIKQNQGLENYNKFTIVDTDDYQDLFLSGTEVEGSCQSIYEKPNLNKCLMAYVFDGKNRLLAVKDQNGRIIARQILRILLDDNEPVLFLERIYPRIVDPKLELALEAFALQRARKLGLPLLTMDTTKPTYEQPIVSLGTIENIRDEYSDAGAGNDGHVTNGSFIIPFSNRLD